MKKIICFALAAILSALCVLPALAEPSETLQGIYDALVAEDSGYSALMVRYAEYSDDMQHTETLDDTGITIVSEGNEYFEGTWRFELDGDDLTTTFADDDFAGALVASYVAEAVDVYYGQDGSLVRSYINGLTTLDLANDNFSLTIGEDGGANVRINTLGPWDMKELDEMALDENTVYYGPLDEDYISLMANIGKMMMVSNGNNEDLTILLGERDALDDLAYQSLVNVVTILQPYGYEDFLANYTSLEDVAADAYSVKLHVDHAQAVEIIEDASESYDYAIIHFGA